jgi:N-acetylglutamate synthase-like GNAT family acetyltransferase
MLELKTLEGAHARPFVDPFYVKNGKRPCARDSDLFFLALEGSKLVGCVRYCIENETSMLRTMMVDSEHRHRGIGSRLLKNFVEYLDAHDIHEVYCLPYAHLPGFYAAAGFRPVPLDDAPAFLQERMRLYDPSGGAYLCMKRP